MYGGVIFYYELPVVTWKLGQWYLLTSNGFPFKELQILPQQLSSTDDFV